MLSKTCTRILRPYGFEDVHTPLPAPICAQSVHSTRWLRFKLRHYLSGMYKCASPNTMMWFTDSRWVDPINLSKPVCQGEPGAMGLSRMPMVLSRRVTAAR